ncbi:hypothetical protein ACTMU2_16680 [Cupriavidus basilensis]
MYSGSVHVGIAPGLARGGDGNQQWQAAGIGGNRPHRLKQLPEAPSFAEAGISGIGRP